MPAQAAEYVMFGGGKWRVYTGPKGGRYIMTPRGVKKYIK
jgi:hypothetical protein